MDKFDKIIDDLDEDGRLEICRRLIRRGYGYKDEVCELEAALIYFLRFANVEWFGDPEGLHHNCGIALNVKIWAGLGYGEFFRPFLEYVGKIWQHDKDSCTDAQDPADWYIDAGHPSRKSFKLEEARTWAHGPPLYIRDRWQKEWRRHKKYRDEELAKLEEWERNNPEQPAEHA